MIQRSWNWEVRKARDWTDLQYNFLLIPHCGNLLKQRYCYFFFFLVCSHLYCWMVVFKSKYLWSRIQWLLFAHVKNVGYVSLSCLDLLHNFSHPQTYLQGMAIPSSHTRDIQSANFPWHLGWLLPSLSLPRWGQLPFKCCDQCWVFLFACSQELAHSVQQPEHTVLPFLSHCF